MSNRKQVILSDVLQKKGYIRGPFGSALKRNELLAEGIPVYEQQHAIYNSREFRYFIDEEKYNEMKRFQVMTDDLIISCSGTVGKVSIIEENDPKGIISQALLLLRVNKDVIDPYYLKYFFTSQEGSNAIISRSSGSVQINISKRDVIENIPLLLPDAKTQKEVVGILKLFDDKIRKNDEINKNLEKQALTVYRHCFIDTENKERTSCQADEYFNISIGKTPPRKEAQWFSANPLDVKWISISDMGSCGMFISDSSEYLIKEAVDGYNIRLVPDNTVVLSFKLTVGRIAITDGEMTTNEAIAHFKTGNDEIIEYLYCYLKNFNYQTMGSTSSIATAVNSKIIRAMTFIVPENRELHNFHELTYPLFQQIKINQRENKRLSDLRDILLPKLMSGELDVSALDL